MKLIKNLGMRPDGNRMCMWALFKCPICGEIVEKKRYVGMHQATCSKKCASILGFNTKKKNGHVYVSVAEIPDECIGCGYWREKTGCDFITIHKRSRVLFLQGRTCREAGIYTTRRIFSPNTISLVTKSEKRGEGPDWAKKS
jgi:predicted nucleic acid-binding Zn ribbon protein